jgi:hypothetical protein
MQGDDRRRITDEGWVAVGKHANEESPAIVFGGCVGQVNRMNIDQQPLEAAEKLEDRSGLASRALQNQPH